MIREDLMKTTRFAILFVSPIAVQASLVARAAEETKIRSRGFTDASLPLS